MRIFVGNLLFTSTKDDVQKLFEPFGEVASVLIQNKSGKNPRSFGFVEMPDGAQALKAIAALKGKNINGRIINVSPKKETESKSKPTIIITSEGFKEIPEIKEKVVHSKSRRKSGIWEKRIGKGQAKGWKKKPGGVKRKFKEPR